MRLKCKVHNTTGMNKFSSIAIIGLIAIFVIFPFNQNIDFQEKKIHESTILKNIIPPPSSCLASPFPTLVQQSDGTQITVIGKGNMNNNWVESTDGYTLIRNSNGIYEYANQLNGDLVASGVKARDVSNRIGSEINFLVNQPLSLKPKLNPLKTSILSQVLSNVQNKNFPSTGNIKVLAILIDYPDLKFKFPKADFDSLTTASNYRSGDQSFKTFYETASNGQLTITVDVKGWYTADSSYIWYGRDSGYARAADLVREAVDSAELDGVDFSLYDNDGDFDADGIMVIHSGPGAEQGSQTQYIWSHRWVMNGGTQGGVTYDGVFINDYMMNPEIRTAGAAQNLVGIGVICHEFGHNLGIPDLYDTDASNGASAGAGEWALMASATWLGGEHQPGNFCAWTKVELGWDTPTDLIIGNSGEYQLDPASIHQDEIYKVSTALSNEYFLIENRQKTGLDTALRGEGLAIWHINTDKLTPSNFAFNNVNADETLKAIDLEEADGNNDMDNNTNRADNGDLFPGSSNNNTFDDSSTPNAKTYTNLNTGLEIRNITESGQLVSFSFGPAPGPPCSASTTLTSASGSFSDGSGNLDYAHNQSCSWLIQPTGATSVTLSFSSFNTEQNVDSVTVYDGTSSADPVLGNFSGGSIPSSVTSNGGDMYVEFNSNSTINDAGWDASYTSTSGPSCSGSTTLTSLTGTFGDGSGLSNYSNNLYCTWLIQPIGASTISLDFTSFATDTIHDSIAIYAGNSIASPLVATYSGGSIPPTTVVNGSSMFIEFITDGTVTDAGWEASYSGISPTCSGNQFIGFISDTIRDGSGTSDYTNNLNCSWLIQPTGATSVTLKFLNFETDTIHDSLAIYDGTSSAGTLVASFSGGALPPNVTVNSGNMFVEFITDGNTTSKGWEAVYTSLPYCRGTTSINQTSGVIKDGSGNNNYENNLNCGWLIEPPGNPAIITFTMDSINLADFGDRVRVYDGRDNSAPLIGQYFLNFTGQPVSGNSGDLFVEFISNNTLTADGWSGSFVSGSTFCIGSTTLTADNGNISDGSPLFRNYADNTDCSWLIKPNTPNRIITVNFPFPAFNFRTEANKDIVRIYDGETTSDPLLRTISGNPNSISPIVSSGGSLLITFKSDSVNTDRGWRGNYTTAPDPTCNGKTTFTAASGTFDDGSQTNVVYTENNDCSWLIEPPGAQIVTLQFNRFETEGSNDIVSVYDGSDANAPLIGSYSGNLIPPSIVSSDSSLFVEFKTNATDNRLGWEATYNSSTNQCISNLTMTSVRDTIEDGSDTSDYENNLSCSWLIQPPTATSVTINFIEFDLNDPGDSLKLYDGNSSSANLLGAYSGSTIPSSVTSTGGEVFMEFITDGSVVDKGWKIYYDINSPLSCIGTQTLTANSTTFGDGSGNSDYDNDLSCGWLIQPSINPTAIMFIMDTFELGVGDFVNVYDGPSASSPLLRNYDPRGWDSSAIISSGNSLFVEFISDASIVDKGWKATYTSSTSYCFPNRVFTADQGTVSDGSPTNVNYKNNTDCSWLINPAGNVGINLRWLSFDTQANRDTVTVYDGDNTSAPVLGTFSGRRPSIVNSTGNAMLITFKSDGSGTARGWSANYRTFGLPLCSGQTTYTATTGTFDDGSGNGTDYGPNSNCSYLIQPTGAVSVDLTFNYFATQANFDVVTVYDGSSNSDPVLGTYSGTTIPAQVSSTAGSMLIEFTSNALGNDNGWEVTYTANTNVQLSTNPDTITINDAMGSFGNFNVTSNTSWTTSDNANWLDVSPINGNLNQSATATANQANLGPVRYAEAYVISAVGNERDTVVVEQLAAANFMDVQPDTLFFLATPAGSQNFTINSNINWNANANSTWVSINPSTGSNVANPTVTVNTNSSNMQRWDTIVVSGSLGVQNDSIIVFQDSAIPPPPSLSVNPQNLTLAQAANSSSNFTVNSTVVWQTISGATWLTVNNPANTSDTNVVNIVANSMNVSVNDRNTFVAVQDINGTLFDTVFVTQSGGSLILSSNPNSVTLNQNAGSNAPVSLTSNLNWTLSSSNASWLDANPKSGNGNTTITVDAIAANPNTSIRSAYIAIDGANGAAFDTIFVDQLGVPEHLNVNPKIISLSQAIGSSDNFTINSNVNWQTTSGATWLTVTNPASTKDTGIVQLTANSANSNASPRATYVAIQDINGTLFDTVFVTQLGSNPVLNLNPDTVILNSNIGSIGTVNLSSNGNWLLSQGGSFFSANPTIGSGNNSIILTANSDNLGSSRRISYLAAQDILNSLTDTVIVIQDTLIPGLSANPDTINLTELQGSTNSFNIISGFGWTATPNDNWISVNPNSGNGSMSVNVTANTDNPLMTARYSYVVVNSTSGPVSSDTVYIEQDGMSPNLVASPTAINLNSTSGSNDQITVSSNINWNVTNPATWLTVAPLTGNDNGIISVTANSDNLSGIDRVASITISGNGVSDQIITVTQIDGSIPKFEVSSDTVYVDNPQGSTAKFSILSNVDNWTLSENTSWLLVNPLSGSNTEEITVLVASRNVFGNVRTATITASAPGFDDTTITVIQRENTPLFNIAPNLLILGSDSLDFVTFNISSNMVAWDVSESASWMEVSPANGAFTQQVRVTATENNNSGNVRSDIITISAPPLVPQTVMVTQDTVRTIGINENSTFNNLSIYPNPTNGLVTIDINPDITIENLQYQMFDIIGKQMDFVPFMVNKNQLYFDLKEYDSGIYFLRLTYNGEVISRKISLVR